MKAMKHELTIPYKVDWQVFKNWEKYLNWIYKTRMLPVKKWQMFGSLGQLGLTKMFFKRSNVVGAETAKEGLGKHNVTGKQQQRILLEAWHHCMPQNQACERSNKLNYGPNTGPLFQRNIEMSAA